MGLDYGTSATYFVDASIGASGDGLSLGGAKKTINEALTLAKAAAGGTIAIADGTYREKLDLGSTAYTNGLTIRPYSTHQPIITGADVVSGWTACDSGDTLLGSAWPNCYKATVAVPVSSSINSIGATDLFLHLNGQMLTLAHHSAVQLDPFAYLDDDRFLTADSFSTTAPSASLIEAIIDADVISLYTEPQLTNAEVLYYHQQNESTFQDILSKTGSNQINITPTYKVQSSTFSYALLNILPNIQPGEWGVNKTASGGFYTLYYYPRNAGEMSGVFEASVRSQCIYLSNATGAITIEGMTLKQSAGTGRRHGPLISSVSGGAITRSGSITVRNCILTNAWGRDDGYGNMYVQSRDDCVFENNNFINGAALFGIFLHRSDDTKITKNYFERTGSASIRVYGGGGTGITTNRIEVSFNDMYLCGRNTHSNLINFYQGCDYFLVYGNRFRDSYGYITWQEASNPYIAFNDVPVNPDSGASNQRAIVDQNDTGTAPPDNVDAVGYIWNNRSAPVPGAETINRNAYDLGKAAYVQTYALYNNIIHGGGVNMITIPSKLLEQKNNLYTAYASGWAQNASHLDPSDVYDNVMADTYVNTTDGNFTYTTGGNAGMRGIDVRTTAIAAAQAVWPSFDFNVDINGNPVNWDSPFVGPYNPGFRI